VAGRDADAQAANAGAVALALALALANKMARIVWALVARGGVYQSPATAA